MKWSIKLRGTVGEFSLDVELAGEAVTALVGPNGAGKSTVLRAFLHPPESLEGELCLDGAVLWGDGERVPIEARGIAYVGAKPSLFPRQTVQQNVAFGPRMRGQTDANARASEWLKKLAIAHLSERREGLSAGELQRMALARALASSPRLLLLDEPMASLDHLGRAELRPALEAALANVPATVLVTHAPQDVAAYADQVAAIEDGRAVQSGSPASVQSAPATAFLRAFFADLEPAS
ncbi:MAG: ATP-binding cassette domain-containing protein [Myxococcota bacterium]